MSYLPNRIEYRSLRVELAYFLTISPISISYSTTPALRTCFKLGASTLHHPNL